ncbi:hypothetical protein QUV83_03280 [Cellulomonas cellasea]|uniref:hypothetical protein n=1 Tax=Cellulomonas cellasea TaxID=43670 RepID=UPI0025A3982E|nr:hypothetical protein [Cellulomonas cellasea]MDM8083787.1 hypothetical protein [Cellulomonas cellasea]
MTATPHPDTIEPVRDEEYAVPLTGRRRRRHLDRLLQMREVFAAVSTERYCHGLPDAADAFIQMAHVEDEIAVFYPDVHAALFADWVSNVPEAVHEPGEYNPQCGICLASRPDNQLARAA